MFLILLQEALRATQTQVDSVNVEENLKQHYTNALHDLVKKVENQNSTKTKNYPIYARVQESHAQEDRRKEEHLEGILHGEGEEHFYIL